MRLLANGQFTKIEKICVNNSQLRAILLHWKGIRKTAFSKKRLKFYKNFAKQSGLRDFTPEVKNQIRDEFARKHCLKQTLKNTIDSYDIAAFTTKISRIRSNQMLKRRRQRGMN